MLKSIKMWTGLSSDDYSGAETKQEGTADQGWSWWVQREQATVSRSQRDELQDRIERRMQRIESGGSDPVLADAADTPTGVPRWRGSGGGSDFSSAHADPQGATSQDAACRRLLCFVLKLNNQQMNPL